MFEIIPSLVMAKGSVWLPPGDHTEVFSRNPLRVGLHFKALGARTLYVIDLDSVHQSLSTAPAVLLGLAHAGVELWVGGGVRTPDQAQRLIAAGASAVVVHTLALWPPKLEQLVERVGRDRVIVWLDSPSSPPGEDAVGDIEAVVHRSAELGVTRFIASPPIRTRGTRLDLHRLSRVRQPGRWVGVGRGIRTSADLLQLQASGFHAAVVGRALYDQRIEPFWQDPEFTQRKEPG